MKRPDAFLLVNVNNTNTSFAVATARRIVRVRKVATRSVRGLPWRGRRWAGTVLASVVPRVTARLRRRLPRPVWEVGPELDLGIAVEYPRPGQIGADRLANAVAVVARYGAPAIVVDFGTALTFDIVNARQAYVGGVIAPGLAAVTDYLYQRTALLPHITLAEPVSVIGRSTVGAMRAGAVIGYRGLVKEILAALRRQPSLRRARVIATGGYGNLIARRIPEIEAFDPQLTLEGLRLIAVRNAGARP